MGATGVGRGWTGPGPGEDDEGRHRRALDVPKAPRVTEREMPDMKAVVARYSIAQVAGEHAEHATVAPSVALRSVTRSWQDVSALHDSLRVLAVDVLALAQVGGMPDTYWHTDRRVTRALAVLGLTVENAQRIDWADVL